MPAAVGDRGSGRGIHFRSLTVRPTSESCVAAGKPGPSLDGRPAAGEDAVGVGLESVFPVACNREHPLLPDILVCRPATADQLLEAIREAAAELAPG